MASESTVFAASCRVCGEAVGCDTTIADLQACRACGFISWPDVDATELEQLYDERYFTGLEYPDYLGQQDALRRSMRRHLDQMAGIQPPGGALLEVGCAYGLFLDEARHNFASVTGIDICQEPIAYARDVLR